MATVRQDSPDSSLRKFAIANADDFGQSTGVNRGIIEAHESGILTSASLMVRWPAAADAATYARGCDRLGVGLNLDLGVLAALGPGVTEVGCHPAAAVDLNTMYGVERLMELTALCDPRVRRAVDEMGIELVSFEHSQRGIAGDARP